jgi:WD40 repeat protein
MKLHLFALGENGSLQEKGELGQHRGAIASVTYSPCGEFIAAGDAIREVHMWNRATGADVAGSYWVFHTSTVQALAFSPDGSLLASGSLDESIYFWKTSDQRSKEGLPFAHKDGVTGLAFMDANTIASTGNDGTLRLWQVPQF